eukprot:TRINITY_DN23547_c0_g1_i1.p1 TRINITY_DN23547_c0_g1~~TRINITY_DN23547_c0_g1_i1.p1  ORF type:complete len:1180 (-),score=245.15 TRINITY_DN23547_c0_g1_i1:160-3699(-)
MDRYPLIVKIPRAECSRGTFGMRHTEYIIEVDDCGRVYSRSRRFQMFVWLHTELSRRELACQLPMLPPKRAFNKMDQAFVQDRRRQLEGYLLALLRLPAVVQDGMIWAFLDADEATAVVPRFLCRPVTHAAADKCLVQLKRAVADKQDQIFRLCSPVVLEEIAKFALAESRESAVNVQPQLPAPESLQVRLHNRVRLCGVVLRLIHHEKARSNLVTYGVLRAMLELLWRVTDDEVLAAPTQQYPNNNLYRSACMAVTDCLKTLIKESRGDALLHFCQQEDALSALKKLATAEETDLHCMAAWILWHGLQNSEVVAALAAPSSKGLSLFGKLLTSKDATARVLAGLCICTIVRHEGALDDDSREHCLRGLIPIPSDLDAAEQDYVRRLIAAPMQSAASSLSRAQQAGMTHATSAAGQAGSDHHNMSSVSRFASPRLDTPGRQKLQQDQPVEGRSQMATDAKAQAAEGVAAPAERRDPAFVKLLEEICGHQDVSRLEMLLRLSDVNSEVYGNRSGTLDTVHAVAVAVLDHFILHCEDTDPAKLKHLQPLLPQLRSLVEVSGDGSQMVQGGASDAFDGDHPPPLVSCQDVRVRAARCLVRLRACVADESAAKGSPPQLNTFGPRSKMLELIAQHLEKCHGEARITVATATEKSKMQSEHVEREGLAEELCMNQESLRSFTDHLLLVTDRRGVLGQEVADQEQAVEVIGASLDRRHLAHRILSRDVQKAFEAVARQDDDTQRSYRIQEELGSCEEHRREISAQMERRQACFREAEALVQDAAMRRQEAESRAFELSSAAERLCDLCHSAPAELARLQDCWVELGRRRQTLIKENEELGTEEDRCEKRLHDLVEAEQETQTALQTTREVGAALDEMWPTLSSEIIMSSVEVGRLRELESEMIPARPMRLRLSSHYFDALQHDRGESFYGDGVGGSASSCQEVWTPRTQSSDAPTWDDDAVVEQEFRDSLHFRAFKKFRDERERLWSLEQAWLLNSIKETRATLTRVAERKAELVQLAQQVVQEEGQLRQQIEETKDFDGHASRRDDAQMAAAAAQAAAQMAKTQAEEAAGAHQLEQVRLKQVQADAVELSDRLTKARAAADEEEARTLKLRHEFQKEFGELEKRFRDCLQDWRNFESEQQRLALLQERASIRLVEEAEGRHTLLVEVHRLIGSLQQLSQQLAAP